MVTQAYVQNTLFKHTVLKILKERKGLIWNLEFFFK